MGPLVPLHEDGMPVHTSPRNWSSAGSPPATPSGTPVDTVRPSPG
jgi:hypothetical protein